MLKYKIDENKFEKKNKREEKKKQNIMDHQVQSKKEKKHPP